MATTSEHADDNVNRKEEGEEERKNLSSSTTEEEKPAEKIDDLNSIGKADNLSTVRSTNDDKKSDQTSPTSDTHTDKTNEEKKVETTTKEESTLHASQDEDRSKIASIPGEKKPKTEESTPQLAAANAKKSSLFTIEKDDAQHLTNFQRQKAKYFFNVNLDIENKEYVTWEDVEFYLLFHVTAAGKEGSDGGDLEARLSRATRAFWEYVHDQVPLANGERDRLTLDQFLDTWASLIDYVVRTNQLPSIVNDLVKLGFELYSTDRGMEKVRVLNRKHSINFFQKMNLSRPYAIMAYKYLTDNGTKSLNADRVDSLVKAVITSSDDEHESHFLIPGFFKTIAEKKPHEKKEITFTRARKRKTEVKEKSPSTPPATSTPSAQSQPSNAPSSPSTSQTPPKPTEQQKASPSTPAQEKKSERSASTQKQSSKPSTAAPSANQRQNPPPRSRKETIEQEDEGIRRLLHYYHIDDGDIVEVAGGSPHRLVLIHPERPLPPYIQQNKQLLQQLHQDSVHVPSAQQNGSTHRQKSSSETKPKVSLEERLSRGEASKGPTVPSRQDQKSDNSSSGGVRQVYPQLSAAQQEEQQRQAKLQANPPAAKPDKQISDDLSTVHDVTSLKQDDTKRSKDISRDDEEKIIAAVLKQLTPIVEKRVVAELRRLQSDETDQDEDEDIIPFPFMMGAPFPFFAAGPPPGVREQPNGTNQGQSNGHIPQGVDFGGLPPGAGLFPPQLLMAMMNDLAQGGMGGEGPGFPPNMPPPHRGPGGVEGFMMFVDGDPLAGGPPRF